MEIKKVLMFVQLEGEDGLRQVKLSKDNYNVISIMVQNLEGGELKVGTDIIPVTFA